MTEDYDHLYRVDQRDFGNACCEKYAEEFAAFRNARRAARLREIRDGLVQELALVQKELDQVSP